MKRYDIEMNGDDMLTEEAPDGRWVEASEVDAHVAKLAATFDELSSGYLARAEAAEAELQKERNRRVEHIRMNKALNEAVQRLEKRLRLAEREPPRGLGEMSARLAKMPRAVDLERIRQLKGALAEALSIVRSWHWVTDAFELDKERGNTEWSRVEEELLTRAWVTRPRSVGLLERLELETQGDE